MGKIDILDKRFFEDRTRFAELVNTEIYHGEGILVPEELELLRRSYPSLGTLSGEKTRDVMMRDRRQNICYGLEIETESDYGMPQKVMVYDASEYEYQIREIHKSHKEKREYKDYRSMKSRMMQGDSLVPTLTLVLYLGEGRWQVEEGIPMCQALIDLRKEEREIGRREGAAQGVKQENERVLRNMLQAGLEESLIMNILNCTKEELAAAK